MQVVSVSIYKHFLGQQSSFKTVIVKCENNPLTGENVGTPTIYIVYWQPLLIH